MKLAAEKAVRCLGTMLKILSIAFILSGCSSSSHKAPVSDRGIVVNDGVDHHYVSKGESLYSIAWRYGINYSELSRMNGIRAPYIIYPGQKIFLKSTVKKITSKSKVAVKTVTSSPAVVKPRSKTSTTRTVVKKSPPLPAGGWRWRWPAKGKVISRFSSASGINKGVDIAGSLGESVIAAAPGVVVYAGSGLRGYGNLLIIKHSERYLSAYAHNRKLLVSEQSVIKAGQKIAEMGSSGTDRNKLHFEIRRDGKPVDPLQYLPK